MDTIEARIGGWLDQRKPPPGLTDTQRASLRSDILSVVRAHAPTNGVDVWIGQVLERIILQMRSGVWPGPQVWAIAVGGVAQAAAQAEEPRSEVSATQFAYNVFLKRMASGEAMPEPQLFGDFAERGLAEGAFSLQQLRQRQRAAFQARRVVYGEDEALAWVDERQPQLAAELRAQRHAGQSGARLPHASDQGDLE